jgi:ribonuclease HII
MLKPSYNETLLEAGIDEAGRGCLAGPVFAAAVILPRNLMLDDINDSKKITEKKRYELREIIIKHAIDYAVEYSTNEEIDKLNILRATILAMHRCLDKLKVKPDFIIIDGNKFIPYKNIPYKTIVKGDSLYMNIAAASILAKTYRDDYMKNLHLKYPQYMWNENKGYPTESHIKAIEMYGLTPYHRKSFHLKCQQLRLF